MYERLNEPPDARRDADDARGWTVADVGRVIWLITLVRWEKGVIYSGGSDGGGGEGKEPEISVGLC